MDKAELEQRARVISTLLAAFPATQGGSDEAAGKAYLIATEDYPLNAIEAGVRRFIKGEVTGQNRNFAPSTAALAAECSLQRAALAQLAKQQALPPPTKVALIERTPEERADMAQRFKDLARDRLKVTTGDPEGDRDVA